MTKKYYSTKSNAKRAAVKELGAKAVLDKDYSIVQNYLGFSFVENKTTPAAAHPPKKVGKHSPEVAAAMLGRKPTEAQKEAPAKKLAKAIPQLKESTVERPVKTVWAIAEEMAKKAKADKVPLRRRDVIAACVAKGVAFYTARTQYQQWHTVYHNQGK